MAQSGELPDCILYSSHKKVANENRNSSCVIIHSSSIKEYPNLLKPRRMIKAQAQIQVQAQPQV